MLTDGYTDDLAESFLGNDMEPSVSGEPESASSAMTGQSSTEGGCNRLTASTKSTDDDESDDFMEMGSSLLLRPVGLSTPGLE